MIRAVVFDYFGVLITENWLSFKKKYFSHSARLLDEVAELGRRLNLGLISYSDFINEVAQRAGISKKQAFDEIDGNVVNDKLLDYIANELKPKYKIGLLSNTGDNWLSKILSEKQVALFDVVDLSYKTGLIKPQPEAYQSIAQKLGVKPEECILVDDKEGHCVAAREVGMATIVYKDFNQFKADFKILLAQLVK